MCNSLYKPSELSSINLISLHSNFPDPSLHKKTSPHHTGSGGRLQETQENTEPLNTLANSYRRRQNKRNLAALQEIKDPQYNKNPRLICGIHYRISIPETLSEYTFPAYQHSKDTLLCTDKPEDFDALEHFLNP
jgi:hypothetical protein